MKKLDEATVDASGRWSDEDKRKIRVLLFELKQVGWDVYDHGDIVQSLLGEKECAFLVSGGIRYDG